MEDHIRGRPPEERRCIRQAQAVPLLDDMKRWFEATRLTLSVKLDTTKVIQYSLNRWPALAYYCSDGQAEIDNLIAERALRVVAIGRRDHLLARNRLRRRTCSRDVQPNWFCTPEWH